MVAKPAGTHVFTALVRVYSGVALLALAEAPAFTVRQLDAQHYWLAEVVWVSPLSHNRGNGHSDFRRALRDALGSKIHDVLDHDGVWHGAL